MIFVDPISKGSLRLNSDGSLEGGATTYSTLPENSSIFNFLADLDIVTQDEYLQSALSEYSNKESLIR